MHLNPETVTLSRGSHPPTDNALGACCVMELASCLAGEKWSDHPASVHSVIASLLRGLNDRWPDDARQVLLPYAKKTLGTAGKEHDKARGWIFNDCTGAMHHAVVRALLFIVKKGWPEYQKAMTKADA